MHLKKILPEPEEIKKMYPISEKLKKIKEANDNEIFKVFKGESNKLILLIGPCSADREDAVLDYMHRLKNIYDKVKDELLFIPRVYTNKPRTTGEGYKGMLHQPNPESVENMKEGLISIRKLHLRILDETGFTCSDEMLYPQNYMYLNDILSYIAVGARSVENQQHRLTASGIPNPVGMKNPTSGDLSVMMDAINEAQNGHIFLYRGWEVETSGNEFTHAILRGYVDNKGKNHANYHYENLQHLCGLYEKSGFKNPAVIVDCNHSNSGKKYLEQIRIAKEVLHSTRLNEKINKLVKGLMIESYIEDGNQKTDGGVYGKSITDPCLGWEKTEKLIYELAELRKLK